MMFPFPSVSGVPSGPAAVLELTADFAPVLSGMVLLIGLGVIGLAIAAALHDTWLEPRKALRARSRATPAPDVPRAA